jgi:parallel beta-helix repeat protein
MKRIIPTIIVLVLFINVFNFFLSGDICSATGKTIYVNKAGGANYTTIQAAVDAAESGDEIFVYSGEYHENIVINNKYLILTGQSKDNTIIDGDKNGHVVYASGLEGNEIEIQISGFTIKNAGGAGNDCIAFSHVANGEIYDNKIMNSDQSDGIQLDHCTGITISGNTITGNTQGSGINLVVSTNNIIDANNQIQSNQIGVNLYLSQDNMIYNNKISGNTMSGISITQSSNNIFYKNDFSDNGQNAQDPSTNSWSYNNQGNYWKDYHKYDNNSDGIGDTPYGIPGGNNEDAYPLGYFVGENQQPVAFIDSISPSPATQGQTVSFNGHGADNDGIVIEFKWTSSINGVISNLEDFTYSGLSAGTQTISFSVKDNNGDWSTPVTRTLTVNAVSQQNHKPTAIIVAVKPNSANYGTTITFSGRGTDQDNDDIVDYSWSSSIDGFLSGEPIFTKSNLSSGNHAISFKVKDENGAWSDDVTTYLTINPISSQNKPPMADAGGPYSGNVNVSLSFNGSNSYDPDEDNIVSYEWDFGDGTNSTGTNPTHIYSAVGNYTVTLTVTDDHTSKNTDSTYANIVQPNNQNGNGTSKTPGFEIIFFVISVALILFWKQLKLKTN